MLRKLGITISVLGLAAGALALDTLAQTRGVQVGVLTCNVASGFGFVFGSSRAVNCTFSRRGGPPEHYVGAINKFGVADRVSYISTAGGAFLEFLEGKTLPAVAILEERGRDAVKGSST